MGFLLDLFETELARRRAEKAAGEAPEAGAAASANPTVSEPVQAAPAAPDEAFKRPRGRERAPARRQWGDRGIDASIPKGDRDDDQEDWP